MRSVCRACLPDPFPLGVGGIRQEWTQQVRSSLCERSVKWILCELEKPDAEGAILMPAYLDVPAVDGVGDVFAGGVIGSMSPRTTVTGVSIFRICRRKYVTNSDWSMVSALPDSVTLRFKETSPPRRCQAVSPRADGSFGTSPTKVIAFESGEIYLPPKHSDRAHASEFLLRLPGGR